MASIDGYMESIGELREAYVEAIRRARSAEIVWESSFQGSLFAIKEFILNEAFEYPEDSETCIEGDDYGDERDWAFGALSTYWRHLRGRKNPVVYIPIGVPDPSRGVEVVQAKDIPADERPSTNGDHDLVIVVRLKRGDSVVGRAREFAEQEGLEDWLR